MGDLTIEIMQQCTKGHGFQEIDKHTVFLQGDGSFSCDCKDFNFRKKQQNLPCKHISEALKNACNWHEIVGDIIQTEEQKKNHICPKCGGRTESVRVGV